VRRRTCSSTSHSTQRIWQARYYDFNVSTARKRVEKLRYMHRNPGSPTSAGFALAGVEAGEAWPGGSAGTVALEQLPHLCLPGARTGSGERLERARAEAQKADNFSSVMILASSFVVNGSISASGSLSACLRKFCHLWSSVRKFL
jgi:hypothetical protein